MPASSLLPSQALASFHTLSPDARQLASALSKKNVTQAEATFMLASAQTRLTNEQPLHELDRFFSDAKSALPQQHRVWVEARRYVRAPQGGRLFRNELTLLERNIIEQVIRREGFLPETVQRADEIATKHLAELQPHEKQPLRRLARVVAELETSPVPEARHLAQAVTIANPGARAPTPWEPTLEALKVAGLAGDDGPGHAQRRVLAALRKVSRAELSPFVREALAREGAAGLGVFRELSPTLDARRRLALERAITDAVAPPSPHAASPSLSPDALRGGTSEVVRGAVRGLALQHGGLIAAAAARAARLSMRELSAEQSFRIRDAERAVNPYVRFVDVHEFREPGTFDAVRASLGPAFSLADVAPMAGMLAQPKSVAHEAWQNVLHDVAAANEQSASQTLIGFFRQTHAVNDFHMIDASAVAHLTDPSILKNMFGRMLSVDERAAVRFVDNLLANATRQGIAPERRGVWQRAFDELRP